MPEGEEDECEKYMKEFDKRHNEIMARIDKEVEAYEKEADEYLKGY